MELKEFVAESLDQIIGAIIQAQSKRNDGLGKINPQWERNSSNKEDMVERGTGRRVEEISFDIAVTAQEGTATKGGVAVVAGIFGLGSQGQSTASNQLVSRIKFSIPVAFPVQR